MESPVAAALIASVVSALGVLVSLASARWQLLENQRKLKADYEVMRQTMLGDVLARRMDAYAALWRVLVTYDLNWRLEGERQDAEWAVQFLRALNECNAQHGVFFSQPVYEAFGAYRACLADIRTKMHASTDLQPGDLERLIVLATGTKGKLGLATAMKDDLGSYISPGLRLSARTEISD